MWADLLSYYSEVYDSSTSKEKDKKKLEGESSNDDKSVIQQPGIKHDN